MSRSTETETANFRKKFWVKALSWSPVIFILIEVKFVILNIWIVVVANSGSYPDTRAHCKVSINNKNAMQ